MKQFIERFPLLILILLSFGTIVLINGCKPNYSDFEKKLLKTIEDDDLKEQKVQDLMHNNRERLMPRYSGKEQVPDKMKYPLDTLRQKPLYKNNIEELFNSDNPNKRWLSYLLIASTGDTTFKDDLIERLKEKELPGTSSWAYTAAIHLGSERATPLFNYLVKYENYGDAHLVPYYIRLNKDSLKRTAYNKIHSENSRARILAAQTLGEVAKEKRTVELLREAVRNWDIGNKGYAIAPLKKMEVGNLLETLKPLVDSPQTRKIALKALANSPTKEDREFVKELAAKGDSLPPGVVDALPDEDQKVLDSLRCNLEVVAHTEKKLKDLSKKDIRNFLLTFDPSCSNNAEFSEFSNEVLFEVVDEHPDMALEMAKSNSQINGKLLLEELKNPVHDGIEVENYKDFIEDLEREVE